MEAAQAKPRDMLNPFFTFNSIRIISILTLSAPPGRKGVGGFLAGLGKRESVEPSRSDVTTHNVAEDQKSIGGGSAGETG